MMHRKARQGEPEEALAKEVWGGLAVSKILLAGLVLSETPSPTSLLDLSSPPPPPLPPPPSPPALLALAIQFLMLVF